MMPVALMASRRCGTVACRRKISASARMLATEVPPSRGASPAALRIFWRASGEGATEAFGDERLRLFLEPAGHGLAFQQVGDGRQGSEQFLFGFRHDFSQFDANFARAQP
jgi:hypothetical protein